MEDAVTEPPPPSRFFEEDLDNFSPKSPSLPSPILLRNPKIPKNPNNLLLLIIGISPASLSLLRSIPNQTLAATLFLPEHPLLSTSPIQIHSSNPNTVITSVSCHVSPSRSRSVAKLLLDAFPADRVLVLDSIRADTYRGRLSADDEASVFKLETKEQRKSGSATIEGIEYLGSGSVVEGLGAAVMGECEMRRTRTKGTIVVTWPDSGKEVVGILKKVLKGFGVDGVADGGGFVKTTTSDLYL